KLKVVEVMRGGDLNVVMRVAVRKKQMVMMLMICGGFSNFDCS
ncbi:hypothetical protein A2U01_0072953, partial [Trifolium medium]|nr:hypothetical protein [Trifolium medium]